MKAPIFIIGAHKSGTSLLRNLFDGHSQTFVVPVEAHFFQWMSAWILQPYRQTWPGRIDPMGFKKAAYDWIAYCNEVEDPYADSIAKGIFDMDVLSKRLDKISSDHDRQTLYTIYKEAIFDSVKAPGSLEQLRLVEKSIENGEYALDLYQMFPDAKFIHILRNPYSNFVSIRKYKARNQSDRTDLIVDTLVQSFYFAERNQQLIPNYKIIRYEDLVSQPQEEIEKLAAYCGIDAEPALFSPSYQGDSWAGNSTYDVKHTGISAAHLDKWKSAIRPLEVRIVNRYLSQVLPLWDYETLASPGISSFALPYKGENLKRYLLNRIIALR